MLPLMCIWGEGCRGPKFFRAILRAILRAIHRARSARFSLTTLPPCSHDQRRRRQAATRGRVGRGANTDGSERTRLGLPMAARKFQSSFALQLVSRATPFHRPCGAAGTMCSPDAPARTKRSTPCAARCMPAASHASLSHSLRSASSPCCFLCLALAGGAAEEQNQVAAKARTAAKTYRSSSARCAWPRLRRARLHAASPAAPRCRAC